MQPHSTCSSGGRRGWYLLATGGDLSPHREALDVDAKATCILNRLLHIQKHVMHVQEHDHEIASRVVAKPKRPAKES